MLNVENTFLAMFLRYAGRGVRMASIARVGVVAIGHMARGTGSVVHALQREKLAVIERRWARPEKANGERNNPSPTPHGPAALGLVNTLLKLASRSMAYWRSVRQRLIANFPGIDLLSAALSA